MHKGRILELMRQGCNDPFLCAKYYKDSPSPPPAPDYTGAAQATAAGNEQAARVAAKANRVSQYTPYGNIVYSQPNPSDQDIWQANVTLSPAQQQLLDKQNQMSNTLADVGQQGVQYVQGMLNKPFDTSALPKQQINAGQTAQDALMSRLNPQFDRQQASLQQQLANQGIGQGTQAYENAMDEFNRSKNDAYTQAALQGMGIGQQARQQALQEQAYLRNEPINTLNAVRTGSQVTNPSFVGVPQQATTAGPDIMGATQAGYNANLANYNSQQAGNNAMMGGLFSLGGAALGASKVPWWMTSDRRLKSNIVRIGTHDKHGIGIYSYIKDGNNEIGVMADEVEKVIPHAVRINSDGYKEVNYSEVMYG